MVGAKKLMTEILWTVKKGSELCQCYFCRSVVPASNFADIPFEDTTCGKDAYIRGSGQRIVGFSFYGDVFSEK